MPSVMYKMTPSFQMPVLAVIMSRRPSDAELDRIEIEMSWEAIPEMPMTDREVALRDWMWDEEDRLDDVQLHAAAMEVFDHYDRINGLIRSQAEFYEAIRDKLYPNRFDIFDGFDDFYWSADRDPYLSNNPEYNFPIHNDNLRFDDSWMDCFGEDFKDDLEKNPAPMCLNRLPRSEKKALVLAHF